jgi:hypothetical protein
MPVDNNSTVVRPGSRLRELGLVLPQAPTPLGAYVEGSQVGSLLFSERDISGGESRTPHHRTARRKHFCRTRPRGGTDCGVSVMLSVVMVTSRQ